MGPPSHPAPPAPHDASQLHPVFFTGRLHRAGMPSPPPPLPGAGPAPAMSPVAHGYVYHPHPHPHPQALRRRPDGGAFPRL